MHPTSQAALERAQENKPHPRITPRRLSIILGLSKSTSPYALIREMVREYHGAESEFTENEPLKHYQLNRTAALMAAARKAGTEIKDGQYKTLGDLFGVHVTAFAENEFPVFLSIPYHLRNQKEAEFKPIGMLPVDYVRMQLTLMIAQADSGLFVQYVAAKGDPFSDDYVPQQVYTEIVTASPDWYASIQDTVSKFYDTYKSELDNKDHLAPLRQFIDTVEANATVEAIMTTREQMKSLKDRESFLLAKLVDIAGGEDAEILGRKLTKVVRAGSVKYPDLIKEHCPTVDVNRYRAKDSVSWRLS